MEGYGEGSRICNYGDKLIDNANKLALALTTRLDFHVAEKVDPTRHNHWTLRFTKDNLSPVAAGMCLVGHVVDDLDTYSLNECLISLPMNELMQIISGDLASLEGCYLYYDKIKNKWVRSGKTSGEGVNACFDGRGEKHKKNAQSKDEMRKHPLYAKYPAFGVSNLGGRKGYFDNLIMYCGMAYDKKGDVSKLCSTNSESSLLVWSEEAMEEIRKKGGNPRKHQLDAVAYLWELCYDLSLAKDENVSVSPGFESFGLRVNRKTEDGHQ
mmetsp:Transcript_9859/g.17267  ORF Transcript_9859/g.17267 Transcript_9859/m.17267 type:complete len:268 (+) Transcript_9859:1034-1837(+)